MTTAAHNGTLTLAVACGGTGGHFFPGVAVAERLKRAGCEVFLMVSSKPVDQEAAKQAQGLECIALPGMGLQNGNRLRFLGSLTRSYRQSVALFRARGVDAVLGMGGFTSAGPVLAARRLRKPVYLHESNSICGRANRLLSWAARRAFVGFASAASQLKCSQVSLTGTPVRPQFQVRDRAGYRAALGLDPSQPVVLVMGGSQGASGINRAATQAAAFVRQWNPGVQWLHLAGASEADEVKRAYTALSVKAVVYPFFGRMEVALGAATLALSRSGASSLAEIAAVRLPSILIPYPHAADNHQFYNARALEETGAACLLEEAAAGGPALATQILRLLESPAARQEMQLGLERWDHPEAAEKISQVLLQDLAEHLSTSNHKSKCIEPTREPQRTIPRHTSAPA